MLRAAMLNLRNCPMSCSLSLSEHLALFGNAKSLPTQNYLMGGANGPVTEKRRTTVS